MTVRRRANTRRVAKTRRVLGATALLWALLTLSGCYVAPYPYAAYGGGYYRPAPVYVAPYRGWRGY